MRDEAGLTLVELLVASFLLTVVGAIFTQVLVTSMVATEDLEGTARSNDNVRLVLQQVDRELRSAEQICEPQPGVTSNRLEFRTRSFAATAPASGFRDIVYELRDGDGDGTVGEFQRSVDGGAWQTVVDGVVNIVQGVDLFETQGAAAQALPSQGKVVTVRVWVDEDPTDRIGPRFTQTEVTGRNIWNPNATQC